MTAFLVVRSSLTVSHWRGNPPSIMEDTHFQPLNPEDPGPVRVPESLLFDRTAAKRERVRRELAAREVLNPFWLGYLRDLSSQSEADVRERIRELGLPPPRPAHNPGGYDDDWSDWWDQESPNWTPEQRHAVWDMLNKVRLYDVVEVELE
jgi:hypothetical protein